MTPQTSSAASGLFKTIKADFPASVVVFLVALPLCLGIALASGAPLLSGLVSGIVGGIVVGALSGSKVGVSGPAAGLAVIVLTAIQDLGSFPLFLTAVVLAGLMQLALGYLRAGVIAHYFPSSVITGMLAGIGVIIFLKQLPHLFGYDRDPMGEMTYHQPDGETTLSALGQIVSSFDAGVMLIATVSVAILLAWSHPAIKESKLGRMPGPLVAVLVGVGLNLALASTGWSLSAEHLVSIPAGVSLSEFIVTPDFSGLTDPGVYRAALMIALVGSIATLLSVEATDKLDPNKHVTPTNQELKAQGVGNIVSGLLGGLPTVQVIIRSTANIQSGVTSKASAVMHGFWLLIAVAAFPAIMNLIPLATLAAILVIIGFKLAHPRLFVKMYRKGWQHLAPFVVTVLGVAFTDLLLGVALGVVVATIAVLFENYRLPFDLTHGEHPTGERIHIRLAQQVSFLNKATVRETLDRIPDGAIVDIDCRQTRFIHDDVVEIIDDFASTVERRGITLTVMGLQDLACKLRELHFEAMDVEIEAPEHSEDTADPADTREPGATVVGRMATASS